MPQHKNIAAFTRVEPKYPDFISINEVGTQVEVIARSNEGQNLAGVLLDRGEFVSLIVDSLMNCSNELFVAVHARLEWKMTAGGRPNDA